MDRPCFLVIDREHSSSISTRKLVIETAKFNVVTAYSGREAVGMLKRFPNVDGIVLDTAISDIPCNELCARLREINPKLPLIVIETPGGEPCPTATHHLDTFDPARLLALLESLNPEAAAEIDARDFELGSA